AGQVDVVAGGSERVEDLAAVLRIPGLDREQDLDLVDGEVEARAVVLDGEDVQAHARHHRGESGQGAAPVVEHDAQQPVAARGREAVVDQLDQQQRIDVPARQHD